MFNLFRQVSSPIRCDVLSVLLGGRHDSCNEGSLQILLPDLPSFIQLTLDNPGKSQASDFVSP